MARLIDQYSAIYKSENWPFLSKLGSEFCQKTNKTLQIDPDFLNFVKLACFYPIWSPVQLTKSSA